MKRIFALYLFSLALIATNISFATSILEEECTAVFNELIRIGKIPEVLPQEKVREIQGQGRQRVQIDQNLVNDVQRKREELRQNHNNGGISWDEYGNADEVVAAKLPVRDMRDEKKDCNETALHVKLIILANQALKKSIEYKLGVTLNDENSLDVKATNKLGQQAFTVSKIEGIQNKEGDTYGVYSKNPKIFKFMKIHSDYKQGQTSFDFEMQALGASLMCTVTSSWRLYGKFTNYYIFKNGKVRDPADILYSLKD